jgi:hypothetical protein
MEENEENERDLLPEIVVDEAAEDYVVMDDELPPDLEQEEEQQPPRAQSAVEEEQSVVLQAEVPPMPKQDNIFQMGRPAKKKRNVSEKQRAHLERIRSKALCPLLPPGCPLLPPLAPLATAAAAAAAPLLARSRLAPTAGLEPTRGAGFTTWRTVRPGKWQ